MFNPDHASDQPTMTTKLKTVLSEHFMAGRFSMGLNEFHCIRYGYFYFLSSMN